eukprot:CAMPEP_0194032910 /NCGR_PEP_ID=MMETSP0009_2-20130614/5753_1 /TAXON_ID=210454 /ORGANISM="Grammatophora oceanica, Strain CCMP 410" /LENGTH=589 /DNA_ID=CAMNT_0038673487 /DNA_START=286 /DNA_END=2055 /DNA_ORIENTATION=-
MNVYQGSFSSPVHPAKGDFQPPSIPSPIGMRERAASTSAAIKLSRGHSQPCRPPARKSNSLPVMGLDVSTTDGSSVSSNGHRRSIFGQYWKKEEEALSTNSPSSESKTQHAPPREIDIRQFSPPVEQYGSLKPYHTLPTRRHDDGDKVNLPPLPAPLQRMISDGSGCSGGGMYPLTIPTPILRVERRWSSEESSDQEEDDENKLFTHQLEALNVQMTKSQRHFSGSSLSAHGHTSMDDEEERSEMTTSTTISNRAVSNDEHHHVHFDPRIVVTEFADKGGRSWYSESELNHLKFETIMLAQQYMLAHPEQAATYSEPHRDPVTGTLRKKALFSLPILNAIPEDFHANHNLLEDGIKKILVVDPNRAICDLFRKALQVMFPHAEISTAQTGEDALRLYTTELSHIDRKSRDGGESCRSFDIVLVEANLYRPCHGPSSKSKPTKRTPGRPVGQAVSLSQMETLADLPGINTKSIEIEKNTSLSQLNIFSPVALKGRVRGMSGSQLLQRIRQLEKQAFDSQTSSALKNFKAVLIGVSVNIKRDGDSLRQSGADMIWGKPPPAMGVPLRNQLLSILLAKRQNTSMPLADKKQK